MTQDEHIMAARTAGSQRRLGVFADVPDVLRHTIAFATAIGSIFLVDLLLRSMLGSDAKFYDRVPVRYVTDTGHLAVFARFIWKLVAQVWRRA